MLCYSRPLPACTLWPLSCSSLSMWKLSAPTGGELHSLCLCGFGGTREVAGLALLLFNLRERLQACKEAGRRRSETSERVHGDGAVASWAVSTLVPHRGPVCSACLALAQGLLSLWDSRVNFNPQHTRVSRPSGCWNCGLIPILHTVYLV